LVTYCDQAGPGDRGRAEDAAECGADAGAFESDEELA